MKPTVTRNVHAYVHYPSGWHGPYAAIITQVNAESIDMTVFLSPSVSGANAVRREWAPIEPVDPAALPERVTVHSWHWAWPPIQR